VTSKPGEKLVAAVAADANVLLSAVLGHAALRVFNQTDIRVLTTQGVLQEFRDYLPLVAKQYGMLPQALEAQLRLLAAHECERSEYATKVEAANRVIAKRDPHDVDLLVLALAFAVPVWSNDSDFKGAGVEWYTTARLLRHLGLARRGLPTRTRRVRHLSKSPLAFELRADGDPLRVPAPRQGQGNTPRERSQKNREPDPSDELREKGQPEKARPERHLKGLGHTYVVVVGPPVTAHGEEHDDDDGDSSRETVGQKSARELRPPSPLQARRDSAQRPDDE